MPLTDDGTPAQPPIRASGRDGQRQSRFRLFPRLTTRLTASLIAVRDLRMPKRLGAQADLRAKSSVVTPGRMMRLPS